MIPARSDPPSVDLPPRRFARHLGLPGGGTHFGRCADLFEAARGWCRAYIKPWRGLRCVSIVGISGSTVTLETGHELNGPRLAERLQSARARRLAVLALSAGPGIDDEICRRWRAGRPDLAMALHAFAAGWVEERREREADRLQRALAPRGLRVLSYLSPGYRGWPLTDQRALFALVSPLGGPIEVLDSGFLRPVRSTLAVFGLAPASVADSDVGTIRSALRPV